MGGHSAAAAAGVCTTWRWDALEAQRSHGEASGAIDPTHAAGRAQRNGRAVPQCGRKQMEARRDGGVGLQGWQEGGTPP